MKSLEKKEKEILEYFWNPYRKVRKEAISKTIIVHLEKDKYANPISQKINENEIDRTLLSLEKKDM